tara:strand:+ start:420 stop:1040 length:621 start_codon:yes stop_codon:yes gene_type:complete
MSQRALKYLNDNRIIYRRYSSDNPTETFKWGWYYANGTYGYYSLFNTKAKINTYRSLKWHLLVLWYLNPEMNKEKFIKLAEVITFKDNNFTTFEMPETTLKNIIDHVWSQDLDRPPKNKIRKIVFKDGSGLNIKQKLSIVGKLIGRGKSINDNSIYDTMLLINETEIITISKIAKLMKCTTRTIHRNMSKELKNEKQLLNNNYEKI